MKIVGVLLAAGSSSRMGSTNKLMLEYKNHTIIEESIKQLSNSKLDEIFVVTGFEHDKIKGILESLDSNKLSCLYNNEYQQGRASSIGCAVNHLCDKADALLFMVADKPMIQSSLIDKTFDMFLEKHPDILYVQTKSNRGHPILYSKKIYSELLELDGDVVGAELIEKHKSNSLVLDDNATQFDIDTYDDYLSLLALEK